MSRSSGHPSSLPDRRFAIAVFGGLAAVSLLALLPASMLSDRWTGGWGLFPGDQLAYYAWIRQYPDHLLAADLFDPSRAHYSFLHPGFFISGVVGEATGLAIPLCYLLWQPVAIAIAGWGCLKYTRRLLPSRAQRRLACGLALFAVMPASVLALLSDGDEPRFLGLARFIISELWPGFYLWGYAMGAIATFLVPLVLLAIESWRKTASARSLWLASAGALLVSWLHPWQGMILLIVTVVAECMTAYAARERPRPLLALVLLAGVAPLAYYGALASFDPSWQEASRFRYQGLLDGDWLAALALTIAPLALPALLAYRGPARDWQQRALRCWPVAALLLALQSHVGSVPTHYLWGITLPLAILTVQGMAGMRWRPNRLAIASALAVVALPGFIYELSLVRKRLDSGTYGLTRAEARTLRSLAADPTPGAVLAWPHLAAAVPYRAGRQVYAGHPTLSPDYGARSRRARRVVYGSAPRGAARSFLASTGVRFLAAGCSSTPTLRREVARVATRVRSYGCVRVYTLPQTGGGRLDRRPTEVARLLKSPRAR